MKRRLRSVVLDATPLSLVSDKPGKSPEIDDCRLWLENLLLAGHSFYIPEIADYEVRRELIRAGKSTSIRRLDALKTQLQYIPLTTDIMLARIPSRLVGRRPLPLASGERKFGLKEARRREHGLKPTFPSSGF